MIPEIRIYGGGSRRRCCDEQRRDHENGRIYKRSIWSAACLLALAFLMPLMQAQATIDGVTGTTFNFTAKADYIITPDSNSILMWGYALDNGTMGYPGPTIIVNQGDTVTINLTNRRSNAAERLYRIPGPD